MISDFKGHVVNRNTYFPTVEDTINILYRNNSKLPQLLDYDKVLMLIGHLQFEIEKNLDILSPIIGKPTKFLLDSNMEYWLSGNCNTSVFERTKTGISLNKASIDSAIDSGTLSPDVVKVLTVFSEYSRLVRARGSLIALLQNPISNVPSCDGHRMLIVTPEYAAQNTGRIGMRKPAIQNLNRELQEVQTVPEGYTIIHCDSGQIEPRITYSHYIDDPQIKALINLYGDAYYGLYHYITMPESDILSGRTDFTPMEITDKLKAGRKSIKTYGNAVMYGSTSNPLGDPVKDAMIKRIGKHPKRVLWVDKLRNDVRNGKTIFNTAFGVPIDISKSVKLGGPSTEDRVEQMVKLAINNPLQGTAADLMRLSVFNMDNMLRKYAKKSTIINYVHDAGQFAIHNSELDIILPVVKESTTYCIDGWLPILSEYEVGREGGIRGMIKDLY